MWVHWLHLNSGWLIVTDIISEWFSTHNFLDRIYILALFPYVHNLLNSIACYCYLACYVLFTLPSFFLFCQISQFVFLVSFICTVITYANDYLSVTESLSKNLNSGLNCDQHILQCREVHGHSHGHGIFILATYPEWETQVLWVR